jgi:hypothetical protein
MKDLSVRSETLKILGENIGETLQGIGIDTGFLISTLTVQEVIAKLDIWDCIKIKTFCTAKEIINRVKI